MRKRTTDEIKKRDFLKMSELAELNSVRYSTIKFYAELGLLPFEQQGKRLAKYYPAKEASQRLKEILKLREKGQSIPDIINSLIKK
jgi:DNA-binding transcriptional MerR regulator